MKYKTTQRDVRNGYTNVIAVSYCALQTLLRYETETAYTVRREGWGADVYDFGSTAIVTGYAPFGNIRADYKIVTKYERAAEKIAYNYNLKWEEQKTQMRELIYKFIAEVTKP